MQCLYCKKRLGLFTKKRFCSELHEVAYLDEQSGLAMRRIMDPLFTVPVEPVALRPTLEPQPPGANRAPEIPAPAEKALIPAPQAPVERQQAAIPARCNAYLKQRLPNPIPPEAIEDAPESREGGCDAPLEVELSPGLVQLPSITGGVLAFDLDFEPSELEASELEASELEASDAAPPDSEPLDSEPQALFAEPAMAEPAEITEPLKIAYDLAAVDSPTSHTAPYPAPLEVDPSGGAARIPSIEGTAFDLDVDLIAAEPLKIAYDLAPLDSPGSHTAPSDAPLEVERLDGPVHLPSLGGSVVPFGAALGDLPEAAAPPLQPKLEQRLPASKEPAACRPAFDPSPLGFEISPLQSGLPSNGSLAAPGIKAIDALLSIELALRPHACDAPSAGSDRSLASTLDLRRYPVAKIAIAREAFQPPAALLASRWIAVSPSPLEQERHSSSSSPETAFPLSTAFSAPIVSRRLEPPFVSATPLSVFPAQHGIATWTHKLREPQSQPVPPFFSSAASFRLPFAATAEGARTLLRSPSRAVSREEPAPSALAIEPQVPRYLISFAVFRAPLWGELAEPPSRMEPLPASAEPSGIFAAGTEELLWPHAQPDLPLVSRSFSFLLPQAGTAGIAETGPVPPSGVRPRQELVPSVLWFEVRVPDFPAFRFDAFFRGNLVQAPSRAETPRLVGASPLQIFPAGLEEFRWPHEAITPPSASCAKSYRLIFDATADTAFIRAITLSVPARHATPAMEPLPHVLAFELPVPDSSTFRSYRGELPQLLSRTSPPSLVYTKPRAISLSATEEFRLPPARLTVPPVSSTNSYRLSSTGMTKRAMIASAPTSPVMSRQELVSLVLALEAPVADCAPLDHTLLPAKARLVLHRFGLAGRNLQEALREMPTLARLSAKPRNPSKTAAKSLHHLSESKRTAPWSASKRVCILPLAMKFRSEEVRSIEPPIHAPDISTGTELLPVKGVLATIAPAVHDTRHDGFDALSSAELQRFRAAARIQIREARLRSSIPHDLPESSTNLLWAGIRKAARETDAKILAGPKPVPLRPPLQTPEFAEV